MGKAKIINLPNGRTWPKKGDAVNHFKAMLARYRDGSRVSDATDHSDLASLLEVYDSGVRHFTPIFAPFQKVPPAPARVSRPRP